MYFLWFEIFHTLFLHQSRSFFEKEDLQKLHKFIYVYLNYYLSYDVCACFRPSVRLSECLSAKIFFSSKMDQIRKFGEQTSRILEFKPKGLEGYMI